MLIYCKEIFIVTLILLVASACAPTRLAPLGKNGISQLEEDEKRLWNRAAEEQKTLNNSGYIYQKYGLEDYLNEVAQRLIPKEVKEQRLSIEVKIIKNPLLNAFTLPNGAIYIHTGFLAKMENESQLATVLAHEISHFINRHTIQKFRDYKDTTALLATLHVATIPAGIYGSGALLLGALGAKAAVSGFSKALETEADKDGLDLLVMAGYDTGEAPKIFDKIKKDLEEQDISEPFFFGSHPRLQDRKDSYARLLESRYSETKGDKDTERFMEKILPLLLDNALLDLSMGRFSFAEEAIIKFLRHRPHSAKGHYSLGELFRQRGEDGDREKAEREYQLAIQYDPSHPDPYKRLGLFYYKQGKKEKAKPQFEKYLSLVPDANDIEYIKKYLQRFHERVNDQ